MNKLVIIVYVPVEKNKNIYLYNLTLEEKLLKKIKIRSKKLSLILFQIFSLYEHVLKCILFYKCYNIITATYLIVLVKVTF